MNRKAIPKPAKPSRSPAFPKSADMSPYMTFDARAWAAFRADTPLTLNAEEVRSLRSLNDPISIDEVRRVYLSLSRLLSSHVEAARGLYEQRRRFLDIKGSKAPFIIGIAGSVAAGKSTTARILRTLLARWPSSPKVELIATDGFLLPNAKLKARKLMERKGFPESFDRRLLLEFLSKIKAGCASATAPAYSHHRYDIVPDEFVTIRRPDILIVEGINVLQVSDLPKSGNSVPFVSDYFDFSIYLDAKEKDLRKWYIERFMKLRETAFLDETSFFHAYSKVSRKEARAIADELWTKINLKNLRENIRPTRLRADLVLHKGGDHCIDWVALRRL